MAPIPTDAAAPSPQVRAAVRDLLTSAQAYHDLDPATRREIASSLVRISSTAMALAETAEPVAEKPPLAVAQNAGQDFSGVAADKVASTTKAILNAVSFPRFVTELINGVFKAMVDSNQQQMAAYVDLIKNVAATTREQFGEPWGLVAMHQASDRRAAASILITGPKLVRSKQRPAVKHIAVQRGALT